MPRAGEFATTTDLCERGATEGALRAAVASHELIRARRGIYARRPASSELIAVALKGRLTGMSAINAMGGWCWRVPAVTHVAVAPSTSRLGSIPATVRLHWQTPTDICTDTTLSCVSTADALLRAALDEDLENAVAAFDWALQSGRIDRIQFEQILWALPEAAQRIAAWTDEGSQSVVESVARVRLLKRGWRVRSQVPVGMLGAIDLVIEGLVGLETDGREFHEATFETDRRKDLQIAIEGRMPLRVSARMVRETWPEIENAVGMLLRRARRGDAGSTGVNTPIPRGRRRSNARSQRWLLSKPKLQPSRRE